MGTSGCPRPFPGCDKDGQTIGRGRPCELYQGGGTKTQGRGRQDKRRESVCSPDSKVHSGPDHHSSWEEDQARKYYGLTASSSNCVISPKGETSFSPGREPWERGL